MNHFPLAALLLLLPVSGTEFPIGLYNVDASLAPAVAAAGFTHILPMESNKTSFLAAERLGLQVVGIPGEENYSGIDALAAWYIADEPEVNGQSPMEIARVAERVRKRDPGRPLVLVVGDGRHAGEYASSVDVMMVDWYPVPHLPLTSLGEHISWAIMQSSGKPVWAVVQAMDWRDYPQRDPKKPRIGRFPSIAELRFMTFHAVVRGASGVFFFEMLRRSVPGHTLINYPERWQIISRVASELRELKPFFEAGPAQALAAPSLEGCIWTLKDRRLALLVNPNAQPAPLPDVYRGTEWSAVFQSDPSVERAFPGLRLPAYGTAVLVQRP